MNWTRVRHRILEEMDATRKIAALTSWRGAITTFIAKVDIQIMNHNGYKEYGLFKKHLLKKHDVMMKYLDQCYADFIRTYDFDHVSVPETSPYCDVIWVCWWQGEDQSPAIVKCCLETIRNSAPNHRVILITDENYKEYIAFPDWIEEKRKKGIISRTHFSDLLRLELLSRYGGLWIDSTFFCVGKELESYFSLPLWSVKRPDYFHASVAQGYFANYSLGCDINHRKTFAVIRDFAYQYWRMNDMMIDYLFLDYLIVLAQRHCEWIKKDFEAIVPNNPLCDELYKVLGDPFDEAKWNQLKENTSLFKLTWKQEYPMIKDGKKTFYGMLIESRLL